MVHGIFQSFEEIEGNVEAFVLGVPAIGADHIRGPKCRPRAAARRAT